MSVYDKFWDINCEDFYCPKCRDWKFGSEEIEDEEFLFENKLLDMKNEEVKELKCPRCGETFKVRAFLSITFQVEEGN